MYQKIPYSYVNILLKVPWPFSPQLDGEFRQLSTSFWLNLRHSSWQVSCSSAKCVGFLTQTRFVQMFSVGFKSGTREGHSKTLIPAELAIPLPLLICVWGHCPVATPSCVHDPVFLMNLKVPDHRTFLQKAFSLSLWSTANFSRVKLMPK